MPAVIVTAIATWVLLLLMDWIQGGSWAKEATIAAAGGAVIGLAVSWYVARRRGR